MKIKEGDNFPTYEEIAKNVANRALDEFDFNGKTLREWMEIIVKGDYVPGQAVRDAIAEIEQIVKEENPVDSSWACGLKHSIGIIRKHTKVGDKDAT